MKLAVVGSRSISNADIVFEELQRYLDQYPNLTIVSGGAKGVDTLAADFARKHSLVLVEFIPDWEQYGRKAGFIRNEKIWRLADEGIAFWDGKSTGTAHSFQLAARMNKRCMARVLPHG